METKKISQLPVVEGLSESMNLLVEEDGSTKRIPASNAIPSGGKVDLPYVIYMHMSEEGYLLIDKESSVFPTFAVLMEYINNVRLPIIPGVFMGNEEYGEGRIEIENCSKISHHTRCNGHNCNAVMIGYLSRFIYVTDEDEVLTEHEMNDKYPNNEQ